MGPAKVATAKFVEAIENAAAERRRREMSAVMPLMGGLPIEAEREIAKTVLPRLEPPVPDAGIDDGLIAEAANGADTMDIAG